MSEHDHRNERIAHLSADRVALARALAGAAQSRTIPVADRDRDLPASFAQQRLWFIDQLEPGNPAYNCPIAVRLSGPLDIAALTESLSAIVARHEVLRTTFEVADEGDRAGEEEVVQVVWPAAPVPLPVTDLSELPEHERQERVRAELAEDTHRPFDLSQGPMLRARLLRLGPAEHVFLYDIHHIANDGWSVGVFFTELAEGYNARVRGRAPRLPALPVQYADYAVWQRQRLTGEVLDEQFAFWREELRELAPLELPTDRPRPPALSAGGEMAHLQLPPDLVAGLRELGRDHGASLFMTLLAGLNVLLMRYSGQHDIAIGTAATDRDRAELQQLIGFFPNTVVLRTELSGAPSFRQVLDRVTSVARAVYAHADLPFDLLVQRLAPRRDPSRTPLFSVSFTLDETPESLPSFDGVTPELIVPDVLTAKFDLGFTVRLDDTMPSVHCVYSTDLYDGETVATMLECYRALLTGMLAEPDRPVTDVDMLGPRLRERVLVEWNDTEGPFPDGVCLHQLVERRAARQPDRIAAVCGDERLTYRELDARADAVAARLRADGCGPDTVVGVCLPKSAALVTATLGVLKAGGAFLPLDPEYPDSRLSFMLEDSRAWGVLTTEEQRARFGETDHRFLLLEELVGQPPEGDHDSPPTTATDPACPVGADHLGYVIYTSGSTGEPKGIALRHRGAVNNFTDFNERFGIGPGDAVLGVSSPSFDMSVYDALGMLGAGGTLVLPEPEAVHDPARWVQLLRDNEVTVWHSAPALLDLVLDYLERTGGTLPALRLALLGGDWIPVSMPDRLRAVAPSVRFIALGGATEASMDSIIYEVGEVDPAWTAIPYGTPMRNQRAYILDEHHQPVPPGVPGELYLGGVGVARGYLHRPELTEQRFVEVSLPPAGTQRIYRTGDRARYRRDGVIELLGRVDFQVKVHGLRIEPGELEAVLRRHDTVADAVVVARGERGSSTLAAFYVPVRGARPATETELREWMGATLPHYMVPSTIVALPALPTTPNGKVDRRALADWQLRPDRGGAAPVTETEARVARVWQEVLGVESVGVDDNFFDLGGDSFSAIRAMVALDRRLRVVDLFKNPTVRALAVRLSEVDSDRHAILHELTSTGDQARLSIVCVPYGGGNAVAYQPLADRLPEGWALWALALPGHEPGRAEEPMLSVEDAAGRCTVEVLDKITGPVVVYGQCAGVAVAVRLAQLLEDAGADLRAVYVGAALPDPDPEASLRREKHTTDEEVHSFLTGLGGFDGALGGGETGAILRAVRHDMLGASRFFLDAGRGPAPPLEAPLHCVFGDADAATADFRVRYRDWAPFARELHLHCLPGGDHYFVRGKAAELADLLRANHETDRQAACEHAAVAVGAVRSSQEDRA